MGEMWGLGEECGDTHEVTGGGLQSFRGSGGTGATGLSKLFMGELDAR